jgi:diadenosine tetraphosphatase ApaH/serine/threonine PP2A family protein phosphatase
VRAVAETVGLPVLVQGFEQAFSRLIGRVADSAFDQGPALIPLFEVLNWTVTIDERLREDRDDRDWWQGIPDGELVRGVRFARNRVHHQWANALGAAVPDRRPALRLPLRPRAILPQGVGVFERAHWRWRDTLPPGNPDPDGERLYREHLARQLVSETLLKVYALFKNLPEIQRGSTHGYG